MLADDFCWNNEREFSDVRLLLSCFVKKERIRRFRELLVGFYFHIARSAVCLMLYNMSLHSNTTERQPGGRISGERWRRALETQVVVRRKNRRRIF